MLRRLSQHQRRNFTSNRCEINHQDDCRVSPSVSCGSVALGVSCRRRGPWERRWWTAPWSTRWISTRTRVRGRSTMSGQVSKQTTVTVLPWGEPYRSFSLSVPFVLMLTYNGIWSGLIDQNWRLLNAFDDVRREWTCRRNELQRNLAESFENVCRSQRNRSVR